MKTINVTLSFFLLISICSCKSITPSQQLPLNVTVEDFNYLYDNKYANQNAIVLGETVNARIESMPSAPWKFYKIHNVNSNPIGWTTTVEDKILIKSDNIDDELFSSIEYSNPQGMRWDLMTKCEIWICSLSGDKVVKIRKINNKEMIRERMNDSISLLRLSIKENMKDKILLRRYTLISPYYKDVSPESGFAEIKPWIFQRDIPLLSGKFEILLPQRLFDMKVGMDVVQLGEGEISIQSSFVKATMSYYQENHERTRNDRLRSYNRLITTEYDAEKIVVSVEDVDALSESENQQPLGIKLMHH